ncbi:hypothetical protein [Flavobacterium pallidum]|uniref:PI-PLC Y-box domain-containing protein n=1 Tax=Flavobacterium pallidum TaxID=2172098 RepID=A0A2S1SGL4_9FLAO|nr:hypothetical protein [Flavobacterium pallidum]AWI25511.1 hypothetical protein HYN49_06145 [Flavobacterium pallidum]
MRAEYAPPSGNELNWKLPLLFAVNGSASMLMATCSSGADAQSCAPRVHPSGTRTQSSGMTARPFWD